MSDSQNKPAGPPMGGPGRGRGPMGGGFGGGHGMAGGGAKAKNFSASFRRLVATLRPELAKIVIVMILAIVSVAFAVAGPKILGNATNAIFSGVAGNMTGKMAAQSTAGRSPKASPRTSSSRA